MHKISLLGTAFKTNIYLVCVFLMSIFRVILKYYGSTENSLTFIIIGFIN